MRGAVLLGGLGIAASVACSADTLPSDLGDDPLDRMPLAGSPALEHLAAAMEDPPEDLTVEALYRDRPAYVRAPDPSALLESMRAEHEALPPLSLPVHLRLLTFNTGLLDRWYPFATVQVPEVDERRVLAPVELLGDDWDVLLLQEVWDLRDVEAFEQEAARQGYLSYAGSRQAHEEHGLVMLVREDLVDPDGPDDRREVTYELQRDIERFPGPGVERGFLAWRFRHAPTGVVLHVLDTHATAFPELSWVRDGQARQLGLAAREASVDEVLIVAGDVNAGPYYPHDAFGEVDGEPVVDWWRNAQAYALLLHYGGLRDVHALVGNADDVALLDRLPAYGPAYHREPWGDAALCDELAGVFTATDCNSLYFRQYAATEYPARIDHVLLRDHMERVRVMDSAIVYVEPPAGASVELSDHYGVGVTLLIEGP